MSHIVLTVDGTTVFDNQAAQVPDTAQRIKDAIAQLRSQNTPWPDVGMYLQTWILQRALSPAEWEVAYVAGFPKDPSPTPSPAPAPDLSGPVLEYEAVRGRPIPVTGSRAFTVNGAPAASRVVVVQASAQQALPVTLTVNGVSRTQDNLQGSCEVDVAGPTLSIVVNSAEGSSLQVFVTG